METRIATIPAVNADRVPERIALFDGEWRCTHAELAQRCDELRAGLAAAGLGRGDRLAILLENRAEFPAVFFAAVQAGIVVVPLNYRLAPAEIRHILAASAPKAVVAEGKFAPNLVDALPGVPGLQRVFWVDGGPAPGIPYEELLRHGAAPAVEPPAGEELIALLFTGGTTGRPKGVMLSHEALDLSVASESEALGFRETDVSLCAIPLFHISIVHYLSVAWAGGSTVLMGKVDSQRVLEAMERHRVTHTTLIPTTIGDLLSDPATAGADLSSLRLLAYGGAPIPLETLRRTMDRIGSVLVQNYGLTEGAGVVTALMPADHRLDAPELLESVGRALPHVRTEIRDPESGRPLADGEIGELVVHGRCLMRGYWDDREQSEAAFVDGALRTGDLARIEDGWVFLHGRSKEMIISGGENVFPAEVESVIDTHPDVIEVAVVGVPHPRWGEAVKAFVVVRPGSELTGAELIAHCRAGLAGYKTPKEVAIRSSLPRTGVGKIDKPALRREEAEGLMFNPLTPPEVLTAIGRSARAAARAEGPADEFQRGQLLSAYSASRHLAAEELGFAPAALAGFRARLGGELRVLEPVEGVDFTAAAAAVEGCADGAALGERLADLLAELRAAGGTRATAAASLVRRRLRELAEEEVRLLAENID